MNKERFKLRAAVYLILIKNNHLLLLRRFNTGWEDGKYTFISGHLNGDETVSQAMVREAKEEAGINLELEDLHVAHIMHRIANDDLEYIDFFLVADKWEGKPKITEPDKCDDMRWFSLKRPPNNLLPHIRETIDNYNNKTVFSEFGGSKNNERVPQ